MVLDQYPAKAMISLNHPFSADSLSDAERVLCGRSIAALHAGQHEAALDVALAALRSRPAHPLPAYLQALSLAYLGRFDEAEHAIGMVLAAQPDSVDARFLQDGIFIISRPPVRYEYPCSLDADGNPRSEVKRAPEPAIFLPELLSKDLRKVSSWLWMQSELRELGAVSETRELLRLATVASLPWTADGFMKLISRTRWTDKGIQAMEARLAERSLTLDSCNELAFMVKAFYFLNWGHVQPALKLAQDWVARSPGNSAAHYILYCCYERLGDDAQAFAHLHRAAQTEKGTYRRFEEALKLEEHGRYQEAIKLLNTVIAREKDQDSIPNCAGHKALDLARMGRLEDALSVVRSYGTERPGSDLLALAAVLAYLALGDADNASKVLAQIGDSALARSEREFWPAALSVARTRGQPEAVLDALQHIALRHDASLAEKREFVEVAASSTCPGIARWAVNQLAVTCHDAAFYRWASRVYGCNGDDTAVRYAQLVVATSPGDADAWFVLGSRLSKAGCAAEAELCFRRSEEIGERYV
jgi:tetratricopeptide (TPR) repeat protein